MEKDFYTQQKEAYEGVYKDSNGNVYDMVENCGYWWLFLRIGANGHSKIIVENSDITACIHEIYNRGLIKEGSSKGGNYDCINRWGC